ncbi:MAG TPA: hypothetical protein VET85_17755 [Stellaceae bacterium]|nr:hypothetical protein [Stellaceae bacterium]
MSLSPGPQSAHHVQSEPRFSPAAPLRAVPNAAPRGAESRGSAGLARFPAEANAALRHDPEPDIFTAGERLDVASELTDGRAARGGPLRLIMLGVLGALAAVGAVTIVRMLIASLWT